MKIEQGIYEHYQVLVYGVKAPEYLMQKLLDERKLNPDNEETYHEGQGPSLFNLHEEWHTLDGWWIGDEDNPQGLVIGYSLNINADIIDLSKLQEEIEEAKESFMRFGQLGAIEEFIGEENLTPEVHNVYCLVFKTKEEIKRKYELYPSIYPEYKDYLEADCWDIREIR